MYWLINDESYVWIDGTEWNKQTLVVIV